ncbi:GNAT family N-acetyltransferase [bacterium]|nr:GNAT family N-acetyltransferase [bacterium]
MTNLTFIVRRRDHYDQRVKIRPRTSEDHSGVMKLYSDISREELEYFVADVEDSQMISQLFEPNPFVETIALVAESANGIVGEAVLVREKNPHVSHVGNVRFYIHPEWRKMGIGATLVSSIFAKAINHGIERICVYLPEVPVKKFDKMLSRKDFSKEAVLKNHYRSQTGEKMDIIVYGRDLEQLWHRISDWVSNYDKAMDF